MISPSDQSGDSHQLHGDTADGIDAEQSRTHAPRPEILDGTWTFPAATPSR